MTKQRAARLDLRQRAGGRLLRMINPLARRMMPPACQRVLRMFS